ncbi:MAG: hypothetical protein ABFE08_17690 [Armatimonadia bacterium]
MDVAEAKARLQVKVARTVMRHKLIMIGNILLVSYLVAVVVLLIWYIAYFVFGQGMATWAAGLMYLSVPAFVSLNATAYVWTKIAATVLFLCPGVAFKICGETMKP